MAAQNLAGSVPQVVPRQLHSQIAASTTSRAHMLSAVAGGDCLAVCLPRRIRQPQHDVHLQISLKLPAVIVQTDAGEGLGQSW